MLSVPEELQAAIVETSQAIPKAASRMSAQEMIAEVYDKVLAWIARCPSPDAAAYVAHGARFLTAQLDATQPPPKKQTSAEIRRGGPYFHYGWATFDGAVVVFLMARTDAEAEELLAAALKKTKQSRLRDSLVPYVLSTDPVFITGGTVKGGCGLPKAK